MSQYSIPILSRPKALLGERSISSTLRGFLGAARTYRRLRDRYFRFQARLKPGNDLPQSVADARLDLRSVAPQSKFDQDIDALNTAQNRVDQANLAYQEAVRGFTAEEREIAEANGWKRLATNSVKLVNILGGYGYQPILASMEECVDAAISGKLA